MNCYFSTTIFPTCGPENATLCTRSHQLKVGLVHEVAPWLDPGAQGHAGVPGQASTQSWASAWGWVNTLGPPDSNSIQDLVCRSTPSPLIWKFGHCCFSTMSGNWKVVEDIFALPVRAVGAVLSA